MDEIEGMVGRIRREAERGVEDRKRPEKTSVDRRRPAKTSKRPADSRTTQTRH